MTDPTSKRMVTHPAGGIYLSKFLAGIISSVIGATLIGGFLNLWQLNTATIEFRKHLDDVDKSTATLPGSVPRTEWSLERQLIDKKLAAVRQETSQELKAINDKLDRLEKKLSKN